MNENNVSNLQELLKLVSDLIGRPLTNSEYCLFKSKAPNPTSIFKHDGNEVNSNTVVLARWMSLFFSIYSFHNYEIFKKDSNNMSDKNRQILKELIDDFDYKKAVDFMMPKINRRITQHEYEFLMLQLRMSSADYKENILIKRKEFEEVFGRKFTASEFRKLDACVKAIFLRPPTLDVPL